MEKNSTLNRVIANVSNILCDMGKGELAKVFANCFPNTWDTTVKRINDKDTFVITGDIPAMWLRDSSAQINPYLAYAKDDKEIYDTIVGVINRYAFYISNDPYANAYNELDNDRGHSGDINSFRSPWVWERKYEVDSLCAVLLLPYRLYKATGKTDFLDENIKNMFVKVLDLWILEQDHAKNSDYFFHRENTNVFDTLPNKGKGNPVTYTGMTWSGFRPSDDTCTYNYLIPSEMYAVVALKGLEEILKDVYNDYDLALKCKKLREDIDNGIKKYGIVDHEKYGKIYAFEVDGLGNSLIMDDPNSPSLLSAPYLGYCEIDDKVYQNTRKMILSKNNPYYFTGSVITGGGSPHTPKGHVWPISLIISGLTTNDIKEIESILDKLSSTHAGTYLMHESIHKDDETKYTRSWFAWANSLFSELVIKYLKKLGKL